MQIQFIYGLRITAVEIFQPSFVAPTMDLEVVGMSRRYVVTVSKQYEFNNTTRWVIKMEKRFTPSESEAHDTF